MRIFDLAAILITGAFCVASVWGIPQWFFLRAPNQGFVTFLMFFLLVVPGFIAAGIIYTYGGFMRIPVLLGLLASVTIAFTIARLSIDDAIRARDYEANMRAGLYRFDLKLAQKPDISSLLYAEFSDVQPMTAVAVAQKYRRPSRLDRKRIVEAEYRLIPLKARPEDPGEPIYVFLRCDVEECEKISQSKTLGGFLRKINLGQQTGNHSEMTEKSTILRLLESHHSSFPGAVYILDGEELRDDSWLPIKIRSSRYALWLLYVFAGCIAAQLLSVRRFGRESDSTVDKLHQK